MSTKKESERSKLVQEKCQNLITVMLKDEDNKYCVDCDAKGPRWASWNLGVFLCIRCAGIHRNLGVHITRVKSVNLDTWTPEQVASLQHMGNSRARAVYEAQLPDGFRRPQTDAALESFIRAKYEQKKYVAKEWVPSPAPKVDWEKEIDEELEKQKRKKKSLAAAGGGSAILGSSLSSPSVEKKAPTTVSKPTPIPAPLPKPKSSGHSPKAGRPQLELNKATAVLSSPTAAASGASTNGHSSNTLDLLGLSSPPPMTTATANNSLQDQNNGGTTSDDEFNNFFSANSQAKQQQQQQASDPSKANAAAEKPRSLAQEEADFFNQSVPSDAEKAKLTKDSIMALYASQPTQAAPAPVAVAPSQGGNPNSNVNLLVGLGGFGGGQTQMPTQQMNGGGFPTQQPQNNGGMNHFAGLGVVPQQQQQQQQMFGGGGQFMNGGGGGFYHNGAGGGIMGQPAQPKAQMQGMHFFPGYGQQQQGLNPMMAPGAAKNGGFNVGVGGQQPPLMMGASGGMMGNGNNSGQFPVGVMGAGGPGAQQQMVMGAAGSANGNANGQANAMQNQFGNLNIGNVWQ